ncbi:hypothetical protein GCM10008905_10750 [Clostridium malenominatum]|uniref:GH16 domain-containing protein n=1 Tax=Clostridium malenominatum TaxID=1539 RepID=A0ABN1ITA9_9CLOT
MKIKIKIFFVLIMAILAWSLNRVIISMDSAEINENEVSEKVNIQNNTENIDKSNVLWTAIERKESYNNELQYYCKENVTINDNEIIIISKKEEKENKSYTSGLVESTYGYLYGYFEFDIWIKEGKGLFPAIWLMPVEDASLPEIDIFEMVGSAPQDFSGVFHYLDDKGIKQKTYFQKKVIKKDTYKVALSWSENELAWYIDGELVHVSKSSPSEYMYIIINQAVGGNWPGSPDDKTLFPSSFIVKASKINPINKKRR